ncbi:MULTISPECIES: hypothetical protein [Brenneria]|uniref:hypothetical protein n=1 Tax=Brenneria TaxID=71655 RepID=UPI0002F56754|nr:MULTISPECIES: hypothetical protein [Brenneria]
MKKLTQFSGSLMLSVALAAGLFPAAVRAADEPSWVASWSASPQPVWGTDFLFPLNAPSELHHQTVRQIARVSLGGERVRILLSNAYGRQPVTLGKATLALPAKDGALVADSLRTLTFGGRETATILPGATLISDPVALSVPALAALTTGYRQLIAQAHRRGVRVIGATLTPFAGALPDTPSNCTPPTAI